MGMECLKAGTESGQKMYQKNNMQEISNTKLSMYALEHLPKRIVLNLYYKKPKTVACELSGNAKKAN